MYEVKVYHFDSCIRRGDLEDEMQLESSTVYKTRKDAKASIEHELNKHNPKQVKRSYHRGNEVSYCYYSTGKKWQNENSGEMCEEYYESQLSKVIPK